MIDQKETREKQQSKPSPTSEQSMTQAFHRSLLEISRLSTTAAPLDDILQGIANETSQLLASEIVLIRSLSADGRNFVIHAADGPAGLSVTGMMGTYTPVTDSIREASASDFLSFSIADDEIEPLISANERWTFEQLGANQLLIVPLVSCGDLVGRFDILRTHNHAFEPDMSVAASLLASAAASALHTHRLQNTNDEGFVFRTVLGLHQSIEQLADPKTILQAVVDLILREPGCARCYAMLWNSEREEFVPTAVAGLEPHHVEMLKLITLSPQVIPAFDRILHSSKPLFVEDASDSTLLPQSLVNALGIHAAVIVPLRGRHQQTIGFLLLDQNEEGLSFDHREIAFLEGMARHISTMLESAILYDDAVSSSDSLAVINEIGVQLAMLTDEESLFRQLHYQISSAIDTSYFALGLLTEDRSEIDIRQSVGGAEHTETRLFVAGNDPMSRAIRRGRGSLSGARDGSDDQMLQIDDENAEPAHSQMTVPITVGRNVIGAMTVQSPFRHAYGPNDLTLFSAIALQAGVAIENSRLYQMVQKKGDRRAAVLDEVIHRHEAERKALVDDIHNNTLQTLAACLYALDHAQRSVHNDIDQYALEDQLQSVREQLAENIDSLRKRIFKLRPATLDVLGLEPALRELLNEAEEGHDLQSQLNVTLPRRLDPDLETAVYRIVQEALYHMQFETGASTFTVSLRSSDRDVTISMHDDTASPSISEVEINGDADEPNVRMLTLIERTELAGGNIRSARTVNGGTSLEITLPHQANGDVEKPDDDTDLGGFRPTFVQIESPADQHDPELG